MARLDIVHFGLMGAALGLAYLVPFELLLLAYVVLGPAHYLTEISWLHDRKYFLPHPSIPVLLAAAAVGAAFITDGYWFGVLFWIVFVLCALLAAGTTAMQSTLIMVGAIVATLFIVARGSNFIVLGTLLPTLVHVSLFTLVFMVVGALRSGSRRRPGWSGLTWPPSWRSCCCRHRLRPSCRRSPAPRRNTSAASPRRSAACSASAI